MGPELFSPEIQDYRRTESSDCYALGMVIYEVLSERKPFHRYTDLAVVGKVVGGERPERPQEAGGVLFTDVMWSVLERCWTPQPGNRPGIGDVLRCLENVSRSWTPPSTRLFAATSATGSLTQGFSDMITAEDTDRSRLPSSPQQSKKLMLAPVSDTQTQLEKLDPSHDQYLPLLRDLLIHPDLKLHVQGLHRSGLEDFVELLDKVTKANIDVQRVDLTPD